jgi:hypothetical protein
MRKQLLSAAILTSAVTLLVGCLQLRTSELTTVPEGCRGWVLIDYAKPGAPKLKRNHPFGPYVVDIPPSCRFETSTDLRYGLASDEYYLVTSSGIRRQLAVSYNETDTPPFGIQRIIWISTAVPASRNLKAIFVGTGSDFRAAPVSDQYLLGK